MAWLWGLVRVRQFFIPYKSLVSIFDCEISEHVQPERLERMLNMIPEVVENGLFIGQLS